MSPELEAAIKTAKANGYMVLKAAHLRTLGASYAVSRRDLYRVPRGEIGRWIIDGIGQNMGHHIARDFATSTTELRHEDAIEYQLRLQLILPVPLSPDDHDYPLFARFDTNSDGQVP